MQKFGIFLVAALILFSIGCIVPSIFQQKILRTPIPSELLVTETSVPLPSVTMNVPQLPTPVFLEAESYRIRDAVRYEKNSAHPEQGCFWLGVGGQVLDVDGNALETFVVVVEGSINGDPVEGIGLTGTSENYGTNSYEVVLAYLPVNTAQSLQIVLYDLNGMQLTNPIHFNTYADCTRNLIRIDFQQKP